MIASIVVYLCLGCLCHCISLYLCLRATMIASIVVYLCFWLPLPWVLSLKKQSFYLICANAVPFFLVFPNA